MSVQGGSGYRDPANEIFVLPKYATVPLVHPHNGGLITALLHYGQSGYKNIIFNSTLNSGLRNGWEQGSEKRTNCFFTTMLADSVNWDDYSPAAFVEKWNGNSMSEIFIPFNWPYLPRTNAVTICIFVTGRMIEQDLGPSLTASGAVIGPDNTNVTSDCLVFVVDRKSGREKIRREGIPSDVDYYRWVTQGYTMADLARR